jgi:hypothetical protein
VLDDENHIFSQYQRYLAWNEQGAGYAFLLWVHDNRYNPDKCDQVHITPDPGYTRTFLEFPDDPELVTFDPDERKFVAVALSHRDCPPVLNAVDTDWWLFKSALERNGVRLEFLCGDDLRRLAERKERSGTRGQGPSF